MNPMTVEWIQKADADFATARREVKVSNDPNYDAVCFHAQQCIEKYFKAKLHEYNIQFGKTHDLSTLLDLTLPIETTWDTLRADLQALTAFAIAYRYPGDEADENEAREAVTRCEKVREILRASLGL